MHSYDDDKFSLHNFFLSLFYSLDLMGKKKAEKEIVKWKINGVKNKFHE